MKFKKIAIGVSALMLSTTVSVADAAISTSKRPLQTYTFQRVYCGNNPGATSSSYWIDANVDLVKISEYSGTWAKGTYPNSKGVSVSRWFNMANVLGNINYSNWTGKANRAMSVYRTNSGTATIGSVPNGEPLEVVSENNGRYQVIYVLSNGSGYKMGWVPTSYVTKPGVSPVYDSVVNEKSKYEGLINKGISSFDATGYDCVSYARKRAAEKLRISENVLRQNGIQGKAKDIYPNTTYSKGQVPKAKSIACWGNSGAGHVAFVEYYDRQTETVYYTHANSPYYGRNGHMAKLSLTDFKNMNKKWNGSYFQGFVYLE